jgi:hypothetical protein
MTKKYLYPVLALIFGFAMQGQAQEGDQLGSWYVYNGFFKFSPKTELFLETQVRTFEPISNAQTFFFRGFFNYNFTENFQLGFSQEYHENWSYAENPDDRINTSEYRIALQGMLFQQVNRVSIQHRYRYDFRFLDENGKQRMRYRLQLGIPISNKEMGKGVWFTTLGNEFLIDMAPAIGFSQNRIYGMLGYQISKSSNIQVGYMYITQPTKDNLHRLQFFFTQKLAFFD